MNTTMKNVKIATSIDAIDNNILIITLREAVPKGEKFDAEKNEIYAEMRFDRSVLAQEIVDQAVMHGLKQKLCDNLAFTKEDKEVKTVQDAVNMTEALWKQLEDGHWNAPSKAPKAPSITLSDMEKKFLAGVEAGITTWEQASELYKMATGKDLPPLEVPEDTEEADEN